MTRLIVDLMFFHTGWSYVYWPITAVFFVALLVGMIESENMLSKHSELSLKPVLYHRIPNRDRRESVKFLLILGLSLLWPLLLAVFILAVVFVICLAIAFLVLVALEELVDRPSE